MSRIPLVAERPIPPQSTARPLRRRRSFVVAALAPGRTRGCISHGTSAMACALGRAGRKVCKREGDGATPIGIWRPIGVLYRADKGLPPPTRLPLTAIRPDDGWCDDPSAPSYNRWVRHPHPASAERLWRPDALYDIVVVLDHNRRPRLRGHGSAIFIHVARDGFAPTEGCIALRPRDLRRLVAGLGPGDRIVVRS